MIARLGAIVAILKDLLTFQVMDKTIEFYEVVAGDETITSEAVNLLAPVAKNT